MAELEGRIDRERAAVKDSLTTAAVLAGLNTVAGGTPAERNAQDSLEVRGTETIPTVLRTEIIPDNV